MGAGFCSLYREIHYIEVCYIEVWVHMYKLIHYIVYILYISIVHFLVGNYDCIQSNMMLTTAVVLYAPLGHFTFLESIYILQHLKSELQTLKHTKNRTVGYNVHRTTMNQICEEHWSWKLICYSSINVKFYIAFLIFSLLFLD